MIDTSIAQPEAALANLPERLDRLLDGLNSRRPQEVAYGLRNELQQIRSSVPAAQWWDSIVPEVRAHPITRAMRQCPISDHAARRPRGYPGDAALLDLIYRHPSADPHVALDPVARGLYAATSTSDVSRSVRERRVLLAEAIDATAVRVHNPSILALACGHLREAEMSVALAAGSVGCLVAADQDPRSLAEVASTCAARYPAIRPRQLSVRDIVKGHRLPEAPFDLVYAAGLYDYLPTAVAQRLTANLFAMLAPGGELIIGNYGDGLNDTAYMEVIMDWPLLWRSPEMIGALADGCDDAHIATRQVLPDASGTCHYLHLIRR